MKTILPAVLIAVLAMPFPAVAQDRALDGSSGASHPMPPPVPRSDESEGPG